MKQILSKNVPSGDIAIFEFDPPSDFVIESISFEDTDRVYTLATAEGWKVWARVLLQEDDFLEPTEVSTSLDSYKFGSHQIPVKLVVLLILHGYE